MDNKVKVIFKEMLDIIDNKVDGSAEWETDGGCITVDEISDLAHELLEKE